MLHHEIAIIGGGPAGSTAAFYLAQEGFDVCLLEKKNFPREVICGEFLSKEISGNLREMELFNSFLELNPKPINSFLICDANNEITIELGFDAYGLQRSIFDKLLLDSAKQRGTIIYQPYEVLDIAKTKVGFNLTIGGYSNRSEQITSKYIVAAYGKRNRLDLKLNRKFVIYKSNFIGVKYHVQKAMLKNFDDNQIQIYVGDGIYCGVNSVSKDFATFCFLEKRCNESIAAYQSLKKLAENNPKFNLLFQTGVEKVFRTNKIYGTGNIYFGKKNRIENGMFMIGDAANVIAPLAGDGISMAMDSAKLLANLFYLKKQRKISDIDIFNMYEENWQKLFAQRLMTASLIQKLLLSRVLGTMSLTAIKHFPSLLKYFIKNTRG